MQVNDACPRSQASPMNARVTGRLDVDCGCITNVDWHQGWSRWTGRQERVDLTIAIPFKWVLYYSTRNRRTVFMTRDGGSDSNEAKLPCLAPRTLTIVFFLIEVSSFSLSRTVCLVSCPE